MKTKNKHQIVIGLIFFLAIIFGLAEDTTAMVLTVLGVLAWLEYQIEKKTKVIFI